jgi:hypothetical protein
MKTIKCKCGRRLPIASLLGRMNAGKPRRNRPEVLAAKQTAMDAINARRRARLLAAKLNNQT